MSVLVDNTMGGYEPTTEPSPTPAVFEVLGGIGEMVIQACWVLGIPVRTVTEVRGWALSDDPLIDLRVDGLWHAFAL